MKAGHVIKRLSWVSVIIAVVSLPKILAGLLPLPSSGVAGDPVIEAVERPGAAPTSRDGRSPGRTPLVERREEARSFDRPAPSTEQAREDLSEVESAPQRTLEQLQQAHTEQEVADYEGSLRSVTTSGSDLTEREHAEQHLQRLREAQAEREAAA